MWMKAILISIVLCVAFVVDAGRVRKANVCQVIDKHAVQAIKVVDAYNYYAPALQYQADAAIEQYMKSSALYDEFQEFLRYRAYKQGLRDGANGIPPEPVAQDIVTQKCGKCHTGANPKAGILLDTANGIDCLVAMKAIAVVDNGTMPVDSEHRYIPMTVEEKKEFRRILNESLLVPEGG